MKSGSPNLLETSGPVKACTEGLLYLFTEAVLKPPVFLRRLSRPLDLDNEDTKIETSRTAATRTQHYVPRLECSSRVLLEAERCSDVLNSTAYVQPTCS